MADIVFTVSQINEYLSRKMFSDPFLTRIKVVGEVTNLKLSSVGHAFFSLKDEDALIGCIIYDYQADEQWEILKDGALVEIGGRITFYRRSAAVQLVVQTAALHGIGDLFARLERTKQKLLSEGLFDVQHKKPLPYLALRIGLVTSSSGAVMHDIISVAKRRFEGIHITVYPVAVQGAEAAAQICRGIAHFNDAMDIDVIIVARGGGSLEDLSAFNEESVVRAVFGSAIPVVSAVGHETDYTLCDLAADLRAPTPSAAAEMAVRDKNEVKTMLAAHKDAMKNALEEVLAQRASRLDAQKLSLSVYPLRMKLSHSGMRIDADKALIKSALETTINQTAMRIEKYRALLESLNPRGILERGYAIVYDKNGNVVVSSTKAAGSMSVEFADGRVAVERKG